MFYDFKCSSIETTVDCLRQAKKSVLKEFCSMERPLGHQVAAIAPKVLRNRNVDLYLATLVK